MPENTKVEDIYYLIDEEIKERIDQAQLTPEQAEILQPVFGQIAHERQLRANLSAKYYKSLDDNFRLCARIAALTEPSDQPKRLSLFEHLAEPDKKIKAIKENDNESKKQ